MEEVFVNFQAWELEKMMDDAVDGGSGEVILSNVIVLKDGTKIKLCFTAGEE